MAKTKVETPTQFGLRKAKELKEIHKWEKELNKPQVPGYILYFMLIVTIVYIVDEITTQIGTQMQDAITAVLAPMLGGTEQAVSTLNLVSFTTFISSMLAFVYKPLSDRYGRKIFLIINTFGMGLGLLIVGCTTDVPVYVLGTLVINFFTPHDMQVIYIQECCPKEKRGTYYTVIKSIATLGMLLIPLFRSIFIPEDYTNWRFVYLIPAAVAIVISIMAIFLMKETGPFMDNRLQYLRMTDEEREAAAKEKAAVAQQNGMIAGFKYMFSHKAILWLGLADCLIWMGMGITQNYNVIMKYGFAGILTGEQALALGEAGLEAALNSNAALINQSLYTFAIGSAIAQLIPGFIADKWGRRAAAIFSSVFATITFVIFWIGAYNGMSPYLVGAFAGCAVGAFWLAGDMVQFICTEMVPTSVRVSVINAFGLIFYPGLGVGIVVPTLVGKITGSDAYLAISTLIVSVVGMAIGSILLIFKVRETKNVDMSAVTGNEE